METRKNNPVETSGHLHNIRDPELLRAETLANIGIFEFDTLSGGGFWSAGMFRLTGFDPDGIPPTFESFAQWVYPGDRRIFNSFHEEILREGRIGFLEFRHQESSGLIRNYQVNIEPEADDEGSVIRLFGTLQEITGSAITPFPVDEQMMQFSNSLNNLMEGCQIIGFDWKYLYINETAVKYGRQPATSLLGHTVMEKYPGIEKTEMYGVMYDCMTNRLSRSAEFEFVYADGDHSWFEFRIRPVPEGIFILSADITLQKDRDLQLITSEQRYRHLFEHMSEGFALCRMIFENDKATDFIYLDVNEKFSELTGLYNIVGKPASVAIPGIYKSDPGLFEMYGNVVKTGIPAKFEYFVEAMEMWFSLSVYRPEAGHFVAVFDVITERKTTEAKLITSRKKYQDLVEFSPDAIWVNRDGLIDFVNPAAVKLFGADCAEDIIGKDFFNILHPDSHNVVRERIRLLGEGIPLSLAEEKIIRLDGTVRFVESAAERFFDEPGIVVQVIMRDITERKETEAALKEERDRFAMIAATVPGVILSFRKSPRGSFCVPYASPQIKDVYGITARDITDDASQMLKRIHPDDLDHVIGSSLESGRTMQPWHDIYRYQHPLKGELWIEGRSMPVAEADGGIIWHGFVYDVTLSKKMEEALKLSEARFRGLYDNATIGLYRTTPGGEILMLNPAGLRLLGFEDMADVNLRNLESDGFLPGYSRSEFRRMMEENGIVRGLESAWTRKDGSIIHIRESAVAIRDDDGNIRYYDGTFEDITQRRQTEKQAFQWLSVFNDSDLGLAIADAKENVFIQVNRAFANQRGYEPDELAGRKVTSIYHPDEHEAVGQFIESIHQTGHVVFESVQLHRDGSPMPVLVDVTLINDEKGNPVSRIAYSLDISKQRLLQERERTTLELLKICNNAGSLRELMNNLVVFFQSFTHCDAVGVRLKDGCDFPYFESRGFPDEFIMLENKLCHYSDTGKIECDQEGNPALDCLCGNVICGKTDYAKSFCTERGSFWSGATTQQLLAATGEGWQAITRNRCIDEGYESVALIPLKTRGKTFGLFQFNDKRKNHLNLEKVSILEQFVEYVAIAMAKIMADEEIRKLNNELEQKVI
ncbi:MAG: PAS domain S-box protein, partial [Bacteroidota bacterium]